MSTMMPRHSAGPVRESPRRRGWPWAAALVVLLCSTGYLWSHVISG